MVLACLAFVVAGFVQLQVQTVQETLGTQESKLVLYNTLPGPVDYQLYTTGGGSPFMEDNNTLQFQDVGSTFVYYGFICASLIWLFL